jgi:hypothetical protein
MGCPCCHLKVVIPKLYKASSLPGRIEFTHATLTERTGATPAYEVAYKDHAADNKYLHLDAAREAAEALVYGQLQSGGWTQVIHFARPARGRMGKYRKGRAGSWNVSSLDDGRTWAALDGLPFANAQRVAFDPADDSVIYVTTFGGSVWRGPAEP